MTKILYTYTFTDLQSSRHHKVSLETFMNAPNMAQQLYKYTY